MTAVVAGAALVSCGVLLLLLGRWRSQTERRLDAVLASVDEHLQAMSASIGDAVEAALEPRPGGPPLLLLDFDALLDAVVAEAVARTGADAAVLRVEGPFGRPAIASLGAGTTRETLERSFAPPDERAFGAALIDWTYTAAGEPADARFQSALVVPLGPSTGTPGVLAVYAHSSAFRPEHASALSGLLQEAAVGLSNARRFAELEARVNVDPVTRVTNRRGYELELARATARSNRTGHPLSVVVVSASERIGDVARLVTDVARHGDIACRRGEHDLAVLLPGTASAGAAVLRRRIEEEASRRFSTGSSTVTVGLVEHTRDETRDALEQRIDRVLGRRSEIPSLEEVRGLATRERFAAAPAVEAADDGALRADALAAIERVQAENGEFGRSLAIVVLQVGGLDLIADTRGIEAADAALARFAGRLERSLGAGTAHRLDAAAFALVLPGSGVHDAEALVDALQSSLERPHSEDGLILTAGITELRSDDGADAGLARAEHALWQAAQAGPGTVVVAVPNRRTPPVDSPRRA